MDRDEIVINFLDAVPFDLYPFQEEAVLAWFECKGGLLISAPTGMGKTLIAESAVFEALASGTRLYYTTPLIALTDQKFAELQELVEQWGYPRDQVGLLTGNRKENPDAPILVVVAEILLNHLLEEDRNFDDVSAVVMDEFHYFNDRDRGVVWELSLVLMPPNVRLMLLSATVGNAVDFMIWMRDQHKRELRLVQTTERKVPLGYHWIGNRLLTDQLVEMAAGDDGVIATPALMFCFSRDGCWSMAERLKGLPLVDKERKDEIEAALADDDFSHTIGSKLRQMLIRGIGVHHAGILPRYKEIVERLFTQRLLLCVVCTETLAAGINLPARSVILHSLLKGKPGSRKLLPASAAHQMFGRAGRPQFDDQGFVYAVAHEDDVKIFKWHEKYDQLPAGSKNPGILKARKQLEKKRPKRRKTEQYWTEGQFQQLIDAGPAKLASRSMIPYRFLVHLLSHDGDLKKVRHFLARRFNSSERLASFERQLDVMVDNLAALGYLERDLDEDRVLLSETVLDLEGYRSIDPLYGAWLARTLSQASLDEKIVAIESVLPTPFIIARRCELPWDHQPGPLQTEEIEPMMIAMGKVIARPDGSENKEEEDEAKKGRPFAFWEEEDEKPLTFPEMLLEAFNSKLVEPEEIEIRTQWIAGGLGDGGDFWQFVSSRELAKNEALVLRHLLRVVLLASEFKEKTGDPDYEIIAQRATVASRAADPAFTDRFLTRQAEGAGLLKK
ncbi:MAG: hypothetical protein ACI9EF_002079 [Pseudohongiellaceae bacterium]|jgi:hypothetical protein